MCFRKSANLISRPVSPSGTADNGNWILRLSNGYRNLEGVVRAHLLLGGPDLRPVHRLHLVQQHVLRQRQHHRPRPPVHRGSIGARDILGDAPGVVDPGGPFRNRRELRREVDLLERLAVAGAAIDVADEQDHRLRGLLRDMDADGGVGRARAARDEGYARPMRQRAVSAGHERRAAFLPAGDDLDRGGVMQRVEHGQEALARHGEEPLAALRDELLHQDAASRALRHAEILPPVPAAARSKSRILHTPFVTFRAAPGGQPRASRPNWAV